jgi:hypothetical protein
MKQIKYKLKGEKVWQLLALKGIADKQEWRILIDLDQLALIPKDVRPMTEQDGHESRKLWDPVTQNLLSKNWGEATRQKQVIEQAQRDLSAKRKAENVE